MPSGDIQGSAAEARLGTLMPASPSSGSGSRARRRPSRRSRRPSRAACRRRSPTRRRPRAARPRPRRPARRRPRRCRRGRRPAGRRTPRRVAVAGDVDGDAAGGEQVGGEGGPGGVLGDGAERGQEDRARRPGRRAAPRSWRRSGVRRRHVVGRRPLGQRLGEVRELGEPGDRPLAGRDLGLALRDRRGDLGVAGRAPSSSRPKSSQAATARSSVSFSTAYAPPAGSATCATCDSSMSRCEVLRAIRRPNASGRPSGLSNGSTVTRVRAADAGGERRDGGAEHVHPGVVLAHHRPAGDRVQALLARARPRSARGPAPRAGARRAAWRSSGTARRWRRSGTRPGSRPRRRSSPASVRVRRYVAPTAIEQPSSWTSEAPRSWTSVASTTKPRTSACRAALGQLAGGVGAPGRRGWCRGAARGPRGRRRNAAPGLRRRARPARGRAARGRAGSSRSVSGVHAQPQGGDAAVEVDERLLVGRLRRPRPSTYARMSQSPGRVGRPLVSRSSSRSGGAERGDADAVERRPGELLPDQVVGVVVGQPAGLAQHRGGLALPVGRRPPSSGAARSSEPCSGSSSSGSSSPPSTVMLRTIGGPATSATECDLFGVSGSHPRPPWLPLERPAGDPGVRRGRPRKTVTETGMPV